MKQPCTTHRLRTLALLLAAAGSSLAKATVVAPYFYGWGFGDGSYKANWLMTAKNNGGVGAATIAFGISGGGCTLSGGLESIMGNASNDVRNFLNSGGKLILSFGGAAGTYLEAACSENEMVTQVRRVIDAHGVHAIDFDVEGSQLEQSWLNGNRNNVIKRLQQTYPDLYVSFTLPVDQGGLPTSAVNLLRTAIQAGVKISMVNIMTMDYGMAAGTNIGQVAINSANGTFQQLKGLYPGKSDAQIWAMLGITPMIGKNDDASSFTPQHAQAVADFAKQKGIGLLSYWALQRDQAGSGDYNRFSQHNSSDYQYYKIFASAKNGTITPPPPNPTDLANGRYKIVAVHSGKCIDVAGAGTADGTNIQQYSCNDTNAQAFDVRDMGNGWYRLANINSGKMMDVAANATNDGANIHQWTNNGGAAQRFALKKVNGVEFQIVNQTSGKCVDVAGVSTADGANIQQWACGNGANQRFRFETLTTTTPTPPPTPPGTCAVWQEGQTYTAGKVVSYNGQSYTALVSHTAYVGTNWNPAASPTLWKSGGSCGTTPTPPPTSTGDVCFFEHTNFAGNSFCSGVGSANAPAGWDNQVSSIKIKAGLSVELFDGANQSGSKLVLSADEGNLPGRNFNDLMSSYRISSATPSGFAPGRYTVIAQHSGKCLDVAGSGTADGSNVQQYSCNGSGAQVFDVSRDADGFYQLTNANSGKVVDVAGSSLADGSNVQQWTDFNADNQRFRIIDKGNGYFEIRAKHSDKCVDVVGQFNGDAANVQQWACNNQTNQRWRFSPSSWSGDPQPPGGGSAIAQKKQRMLDYLYSISGKQTLVGVENKNTGSPTKGTDLITSWTGKVSSFWGADFGFGSGAVGNRGTMVAEAKHQYAKGALVALMYHACAPTQNEYCTWDDIGDKYPVHLSDDQFRQLLTPGTALNNAWIGRLNTLAGYFQDLKNAGVVVLFRPFHEMNQCVFWWSCHKGQYSSAALYRMTHDYLSKTKGLDNIIWVWNVQDFASLSGDVDAYNPGSQYFDIASLDVYNTGLTSGNYNTMLRVSGGKPIAIAEIGKMPTADELRQQPKWLYAMVWPDFVYDNPDTHWAYVVNRPNLPNLYRASNVLTLDEMPGWR